MLCFNRKKVLLTVGLIGATCSCSSSTASIRPLLLDVVRGKEANGAGASVVATPPGRIGLGEDAHRVTGLNTDLVLAFRLEGVQAGDALWRKGNSIRYFQPQIAESHSPISGSSGAAGFGAAATAGSGVDRALEPAEPPAAAAAAVAATPPSALT